MFGKVKMKLAFRSGYVIHGFGNTILPVFSTGQTRP
jgi:hypothetical protein